MGTMKSFFVSYVVIVTCYYERSLFTVIALSSKSFRSKPQKRSSRPSELKKPCLDRIQLHFCNVRFLQGAQNRKDIPQLISLILHESYGKPITDLISWYFSRNKFKAIVV